VTLTDASRAEALLEDSHFDLGDDWRWRLRVGHSPEYQALLRLKFDPEAIWFEGQGRDTHDAQKRQQLEHSHEHSHGLSGKSEIDIRL
jgi:hypothetical protein